MVPFLVMQSRVRSPLLAAAAVALAGGLAGCFAPVDGGSCHADRDCSDAVCSNVGECASQTYHLQVRWTLRGLTANQPRACDRVAELEIVVTDPGTGLDFSWRPVPCAIGSELFDKMPPAYNVVAVVAYGAGGQELTQGGGTADPATGTVSVDLRP